MTEKPRTGPTWLRSRPPRTSATSVQQLRDELNEVAQREEFRHFAEYSQQLVDWIIDAESPDLISAAEQWKVDRAELEMEVKSRAALRKRRMLLTQAGCISVALLGLATVAMVGAAWIFDLGQAEGISWLRSWWQSLLGMSLPLLVVFGAGIMGFNAREDYSFANEASTYDLRYTELQWRDSRSVALSQAYRRAINQVLAPQGLVPFPEQAPDLVELTTDKIVPSETIAYVRQFVASHTSSAIGVAGPRGAGKSTLMSAVAIQDDQVVVSLATSVKYEGEDFIRRLAFAVVETTRAGEDVEIYRRSTPMRRLIDFYLLSSVGFVAIWWDVTDSPMVAGIGALGIAGFLIVAAAFLGTIYPMANQRPRVVRGRGSRDMAQALASDLQFEVAESRDQRATLTLASFLGLERGSSRTQTKRGLSYGDITERVRRLLQQLGEEQRGGGRVVVLLDELDKLPDAESLIGTVNSLKDLFHLPRVHFIVSVSDEALAAFELRGIQSRDAFDSAFDVIVRMERLSQSEALEILESRVAGFPEPLGALCHVWSGGLPRDLIRGARSCVDIFKRAERAETWHTTARSFLAADLSTRFKALTRTELKEGNRPDQTAMSSVEHWLADGLAARTVPRASSPAVPADAFLAFSACCARALALIETDAEQSVGSNDLEALCRAVAQISDGSIAVEAALDTVRSTFATADAPGSARSG